MSSNSDWITVGALAEGFAPEAFILPALADLAGRRLTLNFANGWTIEHRFEADRLHWHAADGHSCQGALARSAKSAGREVQAGVSRAWVNGIVQG